MIMPYLNFKGTCEEAFLWYADIFGGTIRHMVKYRDMPENADVSLNDEQKNMVMHGELMLTESGGISGADALWPVESGSAVSIHAHMDDEESAQKVFSALSEGGIILGQLAQNPPPDDSGVSGSVKDKYGFVWIVSALKDVG